MNKSTAKSKTEVRVKFENIDEYHASFPEHVQLMMDTLRNTIRQAAPKATEQISYNMPAFRQHGVLVYYAAYKSHVGFYPTGSPIKHFSKDLEGYKTSKGAIQFPLDAKLPLALVKRIVRYRVEEDAAKAQVKKKPVKKK